MRFECYKKNLKKRYPVNSFSVFFLLETIYYTFLFKYKNQIILTVDHCSYIFSEFQAHLFLYCSCDNCQLATFYFKALMSKLKKLMALSPFFMLIT